MGNIPKVKGVFLNIWFIGGFFDGELFLVPQVIDYF
jgi:hypothetical protein